MAIGFTCSCHNPVLIFITAVMKQQIYKPCDHIYIYIFIYIVEYRPNCHPRQEDYKLEYRSRRNLILHCQRHKAKYICVICDR